MQGGRKVPDFGENPTSIRKGSLANNVSYHGRFVRPPYWTDDHMAILKCTFVAVPTEIQLIYDHKTPPSQDKEIILNLSQFIETRKSEFLGNVIPNLLKDWALTHTDLYLCYGTKKEQILDVCTMTKTSRVPTMAFLDTGILKEPRQAKFRVVMSPDSTKPNLAVQKLNKIYFKKYSQHEETEDPFLISALIALAQNAMAHGLEDPVVRLLTLEDAKLNPNEAQLNPNDEQCFVVYAATIPANLLAAFANPYKPFDWDQFNVTYCKVPICPIIDLGDRLAKAVGPDSSDVNQHSSAMLTKPLKRGHPIATHETPKRLKSIEHSPDAAQQPTVSCG